MLDLLRMLERIETGGIKPSDTKFLRDQIRSPSSGVDLYSLINAISVAQLFDLEDELARYVEYHDDAHIAGLALRTLCVDWRVPKKYKRSIVNALNGVDWDDEEGEYKLQGLFSANSYLEYDFDIDIYKCLRDICFNNEEDYDFRQIAFVALDNFLKNNYDLPSKSNYDVDFSKVFDENFINKVNNKINIYN